MKQGAEDLKGFISLHRRIMAHWLWQEPRRLSKFEAWVELILRANGRPRYWSKGKRWIPRAHFICSELKLAQKWNWDRKTVRRFIDRLIEENMIEKINQDKQYTEIRIINYDTYNPPAKKFKVKDKTKIVAIASNRDNDRDNDRDNVKPHGSKGEGKPRDNGRDNGRPTTNKEDLKDLKDISTMRPDEALNKLVQLYKQHSPMSCKKFGVGGISKARDNFEAAIKLDNVDPAELAQAIVDSPEAPPWEIVKAAQAQSYTPPPVDPQVIEYKRRMEGSK